MSAPQVQPAAWEDWCEACDQRVPWYEAICSGCGMDTSIISIALWGSDWAAVAVMASAVDAVACIQGAASVVDGVEQIAAAYEIAAEIVESALERAGLELDPRGRTSKG